MYWYCSLSAVFSCAVFCGSFPLSGENRENGKLATALKTEYVDGKFDEMTEEAMPPHSDSSYVMFVPGELEIELSHISDENTIDALRAGDDNVGRLEESEPNAVNDIGEAGNETSGVTNHDNLPIDIAIERNFTDIFDEMNATIDEIDDGNGYVNSSRQTETNNYSENSFEETEKSEAMASEQETTTSINGVKSSSKQLVNYDESINISSTIQAEQSATYEEHSTEPSTVSTKSNSSPKMFKPREQSEEEEILERPVTPAKQSINSTSATSRASEEVGNQLGTVRNETTKPQSNLTDTSLILQTTILKQGPSMSTQNIITSTKLSTSRQQNTTSTKEPSNSTKQTTSTKGPSTSTTQTMTLVLQQTTTSTKEPSTKQTTTSTKQTTALTKEPSTISKQTTLTQLTTASVKQSLSSTKQTTPSAKELPTTRKQNTTSTQPTTSTEEPSISTKQTTTSTQQTTTTTEQTAITAEPPTARFNIGGDYDPLSNRGGPFLRKTNAFDFLMMGQIATTQKNEKEREFRESNYEASAQICAMLNKKFCRFSVGGRCC